MSGHEYARPTSQLRPPTKFFRQKGLPLKPGSTENLPPKSWHLGTMSTPGFTLQVHSLGSLLTCHAKEAYLVSADHHALDPGRPVQGGDGHEGDDGGAVGVGDDAPLARLHALHRLRVDLRDDQGHSFLHPEG